jgi:5,10-methenyltetrahydrofolate synthetase
VTDTTPATWQEISAWRKATRAELIARRAATPEEQRSRWNDAITRHLENALTVPPGSIVGFCWPFKGEFDARYAARHWRDRGAVSALPEVVSKGQPLQFRKWRPGVKMKPGVYDIPVPVDTEVLVPDIALVPMNGCDEQCYRLGYGGGYFDRTLAKHRGAMVAIGVAYETLRLPTIYPQPHDIPMDFVVTEAGVYRAAAGKLERLDDGAALQAMRALLAARHLPRAAPLDEQGDFSSPTCYAAQFPGYFGDDEKK